MGEQYRSNINHAKRYHALFKALSTPCNNETFEQCLEQLPAYIAAQLAGEDYVGQFPQTAVLLDACPDCADAYAALYEIEFAIANNQLPTPKRQGKPNLAFLESAPLLSRLRNAIIQQANGWTLQLSNEIIALLTTPPAVAQHRANAQHERYTDLLLELNEQSVPDLNLPFLLKAYRDNHEPSLCLLEFSVFPIELSKANYSEITLHIGERATSTTTSLSGIADFEQVPIALLPQLRIEIKYQTT